VVEKPKIKNSTQEEISGFTEKYMKKCGSLYSASRKVLIEKFYKFKK
jgi:hypothetical protein